MSHQDATLDRRVALVSGGARRIGAAIARRLHEAGATSAIEYETAQASYEAVDAQLAAALGYTVAALALSDDSISLDEFVDEDHERAAFVFGPEGHGLSSRVLAMADRVVRIPMAAGVDSLNVAASAAVVFYATR